MATLPEPLTDMSVKRRHTVLWTILGVALQDLAAPCGTNELTLAMAARLNSGERQIIAGWLTKVAPLVPEANRNTSGVVNRFGHAPWVWSPRAAAGHTKAAVKPAPPKPEDWTVGGDPEQARKLAEWKRIQAGGDDAE